MKRITLGVVVLTALLIPAAARAQATGAIAGIVRDTTGAVLPGVTVEAASPALIEKVRVAVSDDQGNYKIIDLRPGTYSVTFTLPGFATFKREGIELTTGFTATANAEMKIGGLEETVTVTGASPVVDIQNTRNQNVLKQDVLEALPAGRTNAGFAELTLGAASLTGGAAVVDQGGSKGDSSQRLTVHGMRAFDQRIFYDGMFSNQLLSAGKQWMTNQIAVQEVVMGTAVGSAEVETSGIQINFVPKDGGNTYRGTISASGTGGSMQADNLSDEVRTTGVTSVQKVRKVYDFGGGLGGPIAQDRLWFFTAHRIWGSSEYQPGAYYNMSPTPFAYVADLSRQAYADLHAWDSGIRITWQASPKDKFNFDYHIQDSCQCYLLLNSTLSPESAPHVRFWPAQQPMLTWNRPATNQLLLDAGVAVNYFRHDLEFDEAYPNGVFTREATTGVQFGAGGNALQTMGGFSRQPSVNQRFSLSYVGGSHAFKVGQFWLEGFYKYYQELNQNLQYVFLGGRPSSLTQWALPVTWQNRLRNIGLYAQDQWTVKRFTVNFGVRYDRYAGWVPAGRREATQFTPAIDYDEVQNVPSFNDVSPRVGAAWDLFGNGKTAIKGALGRYVGGLGIEFQDANNPARAIAISTTRTWADADGDFTPDCTLTELGTSGECGAVANRQFGQPVINTFYDPSVTEGWSHRPYGWQGNVSLQQELLPGVALNVGYFRTWYGNFTVTRNDVVTAGDFDSFCITAPADARLPGGGGNQICGLYDINPAAFGRVRNLVTAAGDFGEQVEQFDGVDVQLNARFAGKGLLTGGVSFGRQQSNNCYANERPDITTVNSTAFAPPNTVTQPRTSEYCHIVQPWSAGTQIKANGFYPLPWWGLEPSFTLQNLPGAQVLANVSVPNAAIAPSLGRNLSACPATGVCTAAVNIALVAPQTMFLDRVTTVNLGVGKTITVGRWRVKGILDAYNVFNAGTVLNVNGTYGPSWQRPTTIVGGRLFKFGAQLDF